MINQKSILAKTFRNVLLLCMISQFIIAQDLLEQTHRIPFGSKKNQIELAVANPDQQVLEKAIVRVQSVPQWISISPAEIELSSIEAGSEKMALFHFFIDKQITVEKTQEIHFVIETGNQGIHDKTIKIIVGAPETFEVYHNYPNPFNPTTTISYQIPAASKVNLTIYNVLGQQVEVLTDSRQKAGFFALEWDAGNLASGMYLYRLTAINEQGKTWRADRKMLLVK